NAVGGFSRILTNGVKTPCTNIRCTAVHPRTAAGLTQDGAHLILITVDGRQAGVSEGLTINEMGDLLLEFGAYNAVELDGGGSTTLVFSDPSPRVVNVPVGMNDVPGTLRPNGNNFGIYAAPAVPTVCGNNVKELGEECDGTDLGGQSCSTLGYIGGDLSCTTGCTYDVSLCVENPCGDGYCDGSIGENCTTCSTDCTAGSYAVCGDGVCHGVNYGETGATCPADCPYVQIPGGTCSVCLRGVCDGVCNPRKEGSTCADCNPAVIHSCGDLACTGSENATTCPVDCGGIVPDLPQYCCGDSVCAGSESANNCRYDCGCTIDADCNDANECTTDICNAGTGVCENTPVGNDASCTGGICCNGACSAPTCVSDTDCTDSQSCTADTCINPGTCSASCSNSWPGCGLTDTCCAPGCGSTDPDCPQATCSACFKGVCDGSCNPSKESSSCLDCI
ncbi:MAG: phosphodiester glycosidase family protein, partial [Patescibacteria group bacterium]|nr:phosphodiester glycosidase family protein [Patescibacteria group bacterium]